MQQRRVSKENRGLNRQGGAEVVDWLKGCIEVDRVSLLLHNVVVRAQHMCLYTSRKKQTAAEDKFHVVNLLGKAPDATRTTNVTTKSPQMQKTRTESLAIQSRKGP